MTTMRFRYQHRGNTASEMAINNPILAAREIAVETDTDKFKIGDGVTPWVGLPYANEPRIHIGPTPPSDTTMLWVDTS